MDCARNARIWDDMDKVVNVYWLTYHDNILARHYWDQGLLEDTFKRGKFEHHIGIDGPSSGGIVVINGRTHISDEDIKKINADIAKLGWVLFIDTGDEEALFPWRQVKHPRMKVWVMLPRMNQHDDTSFKLPQGYRPETHQLLKEIGYQAKTQDWFFAGQVNHERRIQCKQELRYLIDSGQCPNGTMVQSNGFGDEKMIYKDYLTMMGKTKIVLCPSGIESPDNFRVYEALEAGCVPIVDQFSTNFKTPGFWKYILGDDIPFPIVDYWDALPKLMPELLRNYPELSVKCFAWWQIKKQQIFDKLIEDIKELSR